MRLLICCCAVLGFAAGCGTGSDVRFLVETEGEARATELELRIGGETRYFAEVEHGREIVERDVPEGTDVSLRARNGGGEGGLLIGAFVDGCAVSAHECTGTACIVYSQLTVRSGC